MPETDEAIRHDDTKSTLTTEEIDALVGHGSPDQIAASLDRVDAADLVRLLSRLDDGTRSGLLTLLAPDDAAELLRAMPHSQAVEAVGNLEPVAAARILEALPSDERADLVGELDDTEAEPIICEFSDPDAEEVRALAAYDDDVAGGLMRTEYLDYNDRLTIADVVADLGANADEYADYDIQYAYVTDDAGRLVGVLPMRDLLLSPRSRKLGDIMISAPLSVRDDASLESLAGFFSSHKFFGVPVVDGDGVLRGVVHRAAIELAMSEDQEQMYRSAQGIVGGEELRTMPVLLRARRRLSWLSINIVLNIMAASVIAMHQDTLEAVIALAVFLPIISDMSGCSGNQAVAVSMRELTLGVIKATDLARTVLAEVAVGLINGLVLGVLIGIVAGVWQANPYLGLVVGGALFLNTLLAVIVGGSVPLLLKRLGVDPAIAAGPILTTITDMCGFFLVLTFASAMLSHLA